MTALNKQALREAANAANIASWGKWESYKPHKGARGYEVKVGAKAVAQHCLKVDAAFIAAANPTTVLALLDENIQLQRDKDSLEAAAIAMRDDMREAREKLEVAEKRIAETSQRNSDLVAKIELMDRRIAELSASHSKLRDTMATIHNTIRMDGGYTPLAAILNATKRAHEESASAAGIGVKGE
ncbi:ead/Ea22-like family protein [Citrobacter meridianamericanus]|uniref:Ead/Ea22-like family protein n=1 Tax=Citrobacter meridianamericanus TaxID=2894201 RepID=A0ABT1B411_9ENTR|nr:ead/Ea22-like family protein [Citrobacter meridianamericanus]MCO5780623.1 ead/Ea22-like family protein [Citrobacter meridianamericanus]